MRGCTREIVATIAANNKQTTPKLHEKQVITSNHVGELRMERTIVCKLESKKCMIM